jgi:hypothetical protein
VWKAARTSIERSQHLAEPVADIARANALLAQGDEAGACALVEASARRHEEAIFAWIGKDLNAAEPAGNHLIWLLRHRDESAELWDDLERLLAIGKLVKKRSEFKVLLLLVAAETLGDLGEEERARGLLRGAARYYDQQLSVWAEEPYPNQRIVELRELKERVEAPA